MGFFDIFKVKEEVALDTDAELKQWRDSLDRKRKECIERMGDKWILHPNHHIKKLDVPANTLGFK